VVRAAAGPRARFLGFSMPSFSLSTMISLLVLLVTKRKQGGQGAYLCRFLPEWGDGLARELLRSDIKFFVGDLIFAGDVDAVGADFEAFSLCFKSKSPIFARRSAIGIRLTLISIRVRSPCAWSIYCARSFLARSVTIECISGLLSVVK
jgi:hypothetical protein